MLYNYGFVCVYKSYRFLNELVELAFLISNGLVVTANLSEVVRCDFLVLKVNATHTQNRFINQEPANFIK